jgi:hypothetical protein
VRQLEAEQGVRPGIAHLAVGADHGIGVHPDDVIRRFTAEPAALRTGAYVSSASGQPTAGPRARRSAVISPSTTPRRTTAGDLPHGPPTPPRRSPSSQPKPRRCATGHNLNHVRHARTASPTGR